MEQAGAQLGKALYLHSIYGSVHKLVILQNLRYIKKSSMYYMKYVLDYFICFGLFYLPANPDMLFYNQCQV